MNNKLNVKQKKFKDMFKKLIRHGDEIHLRNGAIITDITNDYKALLMHDGLIEQINLTDITNFNYDHKLRAKDFDMDVIKIIYKHGTIDTLNDIDSIDTKLRISGFSRLQSDVVCDIIKEIVDDAILEYSNIDKVKTQFTKEEL